MLRDGFNYTKFNKKSEFLRENNYSYFQIIVSFRRDSQVVSQWDLLVTFRCRCRMDPSAVSCLLCKAMLPAQHGEEGVKKTTDYITSLTSGKAVVNSRHDKLELAEDDPDVIIFDDLPENENIDKGGIQNGKKM